MLATTSTWDASGTSTADPTSLATLSVPWDPRIPYPIFAIAAHLYLRDCPIEAGPTGVIPRSHMSGQAPPFERACRRRSASGKATVPCPSLPRRVTSPSSSRTFGTDGCALALEIPDACSSNATTGVAILPSESDHRRWRTSSRGGGGSCANQPGEDARRAPSVGVLRRLTRRHSPHPGCRAEADRLRPGHSALAPVRRTPGTISEDTGEIEDLEWNMSERVGPTKNELVDLFGGRPGWRLEAQVDARRHATVVLRRRPARSNSR